MKKFYYGLVIVFLSLLVLATCINQFVGSMCGNQVVTETVSPNGKQKIVVFVRDCGATTGISTQVSVKRIGEKLGGDEKGNIVIISDNYSGGSYNHFGGADVMVRWISDDKVLFRIDDAAELMKRSEEINGISFIYE